MKIKKIIIYHLKLPLVHFFETSFGRTYDNHTLIIETHTDKGEGFGECPASSAPLYSYETVETAYHIIKDFLIPRLKGGDIQHPSMLVKLFSFIRGHNMAKASIEMSLWDVYARNQNKPLYQVLGGVVDEIPAGISLGLEKSYDDLSKKIQSALERGYHRIKIKIKPGQDVKLVSAVRKEFGDINLMVDANAAYKLSDMDILKKLDRFSLMMIEQPLDWDDIIDHASLQKKLKTPICLDESIKSPQDATKAIKIRACNVINIKQARVGGTTNAIEIHNIAKKMKIPVWCGGLLESGVGRLHNIALATLPNFKFPGDISESSRYYQQDIIDPPVILTRKGTIKVSPQPGIGHKVLHNAIKKYTLSVSRFHLL